MTLPEAYDYNEVYGTLPVYDQGSNPSCWTEAHILLMTALNHIHYGLGRNPFDFMTIRSSGVMLDNDWEHKRYGRWAMTGILQHVIWNDGFGVSASDKEAIKRALIKNGVVDAAIHATQSFQNARVTDGQIPVVRPLESDSIEDSFGHEQVFVGYNEYGVISQNSWGPGYGLRGRVILSWEWIEKFCPTILPYGIDNFLLDSLPDIPTVRFSQASLEKVMFHGYYIKKLSRPAQFLMIGANKFWIRTNEMAVEQGLTPEQLHVLPDNHPYFDNAKYPIIGAQPPASAM